MSKPTTLEKIVNALQKVPDEINAEILKMANTMTEAQIITQFNQQSLDFFNCAVDVTKSMNKVKEYGFEAYLQFYHLAIKSDARMPIDQFCMVVLEFAPSIYNEDEDMFLNMNMGDAQLQEQFGNNEFSMIRSDKFKNLWKTLSVEHKNRIKDHLIHCTSSAHAFFYKSVLLRS